MIRDSRCKVLEDSGFHAVSASLKYGVILLSHQTFDLVIISSLPQPALTMITSIVGSADILILDDIVTRDNLLAVVSERVARFWPRQA